MERFSNKRIKVNKLTDRVSSVIMMIEIFLAALIILAVIGGAGALIIDTLQSSTLDKLLDYDYFQSLLSYLLMLIIGLELGLMLIKHDPRNVIDVMIYAIARKMLIYSTATFDMLIGVVALGILFLIKFSFGKWNLTVKEQKQTNN
ncbi:hypothetical protein DES38_10619 [Streptohalobacillus salinus]|uniref:Transporter n=1 Tax=Streptohalobacillus salinus TaxID=621096 RepID=A0A2V3WFI8_9BACI|nr:hypothetical protein [Streptohalobacillus salinus]PXW90985.1 hypothetical protein DES38_10619 [Streptohalobacillus salinus]